MAQRDLSNFRSVTQVVPEVPSQLLGAVGQIGERIVQQQMEAQFAEKMSAAQLELNALDNQYQIDYEGNPMGGLKELSASRKATLQKYGSEISPLMGQQWRQAEQELSNRSSAAIQAWGMKQTIVNTKNSMQRMIENDLAQAAQNGLAYAKSGDAQFLAFADYANSKSRLEQVAAGKIGSETFGQLIEDYDQDYMKTFLSGVAQANPSKAAELLRDERIAGSFKNPLEVLKMRDAFDTRARVVARKAEQGQEVNKIDGINGLVQASLAKPMDFASLEQALTAGGIDGPARDLLLQLNGYGAGQKKLADEQKIEYRMKVYDAITALADDKEGVTPKNVAAIQEAVINGMANGAITNTDGIKFINQVVEPLTQQQKKIIESYGEGDYNPFVDKIGFDGIESYYEKIKVDADSLKGSDKTQAELRNNITKSKLYDYYFSSLEVEASAFPGRPAVADIPGLPAKDRNELYRRAQQTAQKLFLQDRYPALRTLPDAPNLIIRDGQVVEGVIGNRQLSPVASVQPRYKLMLRGRDLYRLYPDGTEEFHSPAPEGMQE